MRASAGCFQHLQTLGFQHHTANKIPQEREALGCTLQFCSKRENSVQAKTSKAASVMFFLLKEGQLLEYCCEGLSVCAQLSLKVCPSTGNFREELSIDSSYTHLFFTEIVFKDSHNPLGKLLMEQKHFSPLSSLVCKFFLLHLPQLFKLTQFHAPNYPSYSSGQMICPLDAGDMAEKTLIRFSGCTKYLDS